MSRLLIYFLLLFGVCSNIIAENDSIYVIHSGKVVHKESLSKVDSISFVNYKYNKSISEKILIDSRFSLFSKALVLTGLSDYIRMNEGDDFNFDSNIKLWPTMTHTVPEEYPKYRKNGFTILAPSDSVLANFKECPVRPNGVHNMSDLEAVAEYYYSKVNKDGEGITNYKDKRNYLNRFVAYHCINKSLSVSRFIRDFYTPHMYISISMYEYIETLLDNTLIEVKLDRSIKKPMSEFGVLNSENDTTKGVYFLRSFTGISKCGYYHEISKPLIYSLDFEKYLSNTRMRMDFASFFPELASNNMRGNNPKAVTAVMGVTHAYLLPGGYLNRMITLDNQKLSYLGACGAYESYQGDEFYIIGKYDISITTLPIPSGFYEVRISHQPTLYRGLVRIYLDDICIMDSLNLSALAKDSIIGWVLPGSDKYDYKGLKNDSLLRQRGYMKGPSSFYCPDHWYGYNANSARNSPSNLRLILGQFQFSENKKHKLRIVSIGGKINSPQLQLDYIEFMPVNLIESEGVD